MGVTGLAIEWMQYPVSLGSENESMTITWRDGTEDHIPAHDGDGETIFQLPRLMDLIFEIENFNCSDGQSAKFVDEYPALFRSETGVLVLRVMSNESFMNAFVCKSKDPTECLLSWINGDIREWLDPADYPPEGSTDFHWVSAREVLAFFGTHLLEEFPPIVFDPNEDQIDHDQSFEELGFVKVDLPWWSPPSREGPAFGYPARLFMPDSYEHELTFEELGSPSVAVSISNRLTPDEWNRLVKGCLPGSIAEKISSNSDDYRSRFDAVIRTASGLGEVWLSRWRNLY